MGPGMDTKSKSYVRIMERDTRSFKLSRNKPDGFGNSKEEEAAGQRSLKPLAAG